MDKFECIMDYFMNPWLHLRAFAGLYLILPALHFPSIESKMTVHESQTEKIQTPEFLCDTGKLL